MHANERLPSAARSLVVSAVTGEGVDELLDRLGLLAREAAAAEPPRRPHVVLRPGRPHFAVTRTRGRVWRGRTARRWSAG